MNRKFIIAISIIAAALAVLVYSGVRESAKAVVTVEQLKSEAAPRKNIRIGARVAEGEIHYSTSPEFQLSFFIRGLSSESNTIPVLFHGVRPDTFQIGRDVIMDGSFDGERFDAKSLSTQCPSKYEPPKPPQ